MTDNLAKADLKYLIKNMRPTVSEESYAFVSLTEEDNKLIDHSVMFFKEKEGVTYILPCKIAKELKLPFVSTFAWITLNVNSTLNAIGFTATFSSVLAKNNISCNVIAGYYHDHIFVDYELKDKAISVLNNLSNNSNQNCI